MTAKVARAEKTAVALALGASTQPPRADTDAFVQRARAVCLRAGQSFTSLRRDVLALLHELDRPMSAYDLAPLCAERFGRKVYPSSAYRVLQFWCDRGIVAHLTGHNAFVLTSALADDFVRIVFVCSQCGSALQYGDARRARHFTSRLARFPSIRARIPSKLAVSALAANPEVIA